MSLLIFLTTTLIGIVSHVAFRNIYISIASGILFLALFLLKGSILIVPLVMGFAKFSWWITQKK